MSAPMHSTITYLIDKNGTVIHTWPSDYIPGQSVYMLDDGSILRTIRLSPFGAGTGGGIQRIKWDGTLIWDFRYFTDDYLSHHDIEPLPNGNVLMIAWEYKTRNEAIAAGRDPNKLIGNTLDPDHIIEIEPTSPTNGKIVWEWHAWDHLIQDYDNTKDNYGVIEDHPELIDINYGPITGDWMHTNSIDYNEEFDQILLSIKHFDEIWVIDHSTTPKEAAGHTGGNSGKGGDILYRWGNPMAYRAGNEDDQKFRRQHDARWIETGCPGEGNILVFNNLGGLPDDWYSTVDEIVPPVDSNGNYHLETGSAFGPEEQIWIYNTNHCEYLLCGAQRVSNGNTFVTIGSSGYLYEVTPEKEIVRLYKNPYPTDSPYKNIFKYECYQNLDFSQLEPNLACIGKINWRDISAGETLFGSFQVENIGGSDSLLSWKIKSYPEWGTWSFSHQSGENLSPDDGPISIDITVVAPIDKDKDFEGYIVVENQEDPEDFDVIPVFLNTPIQRTFNSLFFNRIRYCLPTLSILLFRLIATLGK